MGLVAGFEADDDPGCVHLFQMWTTPERRRAGLGRRLVGAGDKLYMMILRDITKRKQAEEALIISEEKYRTISTTAKDAILMMDDEGKYYFTQLFYRK